MESKLSTRHLLTSLYDVFFSLFAQGDSGKKGRRGYNGLNGDKVKCDFEI